MDLTTVEANKNIVLNHLFANGQSEFTQNVSIPFIPDYMIVRGINYSPASTDTVDAYLLWSDLVGDFIGSFVINQQNATPTVQATTTALGQYFKVGRPVTGDMLTRIMTNVVGNGALHIAGRICIHLDFVKLKAEKPQKVY
jgi:hypothetical protein